VLEAWWGRDEADELHQFESSGQHAETEHVLPGAKVVTFWQALNVLRRIEETISLECDIRWYELTQTFKTWSAWGNGMGAQVTALDSTWFARFEADATVDYRDEMCVGVPRSRCKALLMHRSRM